MDWAEAIRATTARLEASPFLKLDPTLPDDLAAYLLTGAGPDVLQRVVDLRNSNVLAMNDHIEPGHPVRDLYAAFADAPHDVLVRWGRAIDAGPRHLHELRVDGESWPGTMLVQVGWLFPDGPLPFDLSAFAALLAAADVHSGKLFVNAWKIDPLPWHRELPGLVLARLDGYSHGVQALREWLAPMVVDGPLERRLHALTMLETVTDGVLAEYAEQLVAAATGTSAQVRAAAAGLVSRAAATERLREVATSGKPDERRPALQLLWAHGDQAWARETALADRAASVRAVAEEFTERREAVPVPSVADPDPIDWAVEWTDGLAETVTALSTERSAWLRAGVSTTSEAARMTAAEVVAAYREVLTSAAPPRAVLSQSYLFRRGAAIGAALDADLISTPALVKLLVAGDELGRYHGYWSLTWSAGELHRHRGLTLLELAAALDGAPATDGPRTVAAAWFADRDDALGRDWDPDAVWPAVARHLDVFLDYWHERRAGHSYDFDSEALFLLVAAFPEPPTRLVELCYDLALGSAKSDQRAAQDFLSDHPEAVRRATAALGDGTGTVRVQAAQWLGRLGDRGAVPALAGAFGTERNETVQGALLEALVALGERLEDHFDLASVDAQAAKALAKGLPAALSWLDPDRLPGVRRAAGSEDVPATTLLWLVTRAVAAKSSVPSALQRACVAQLDPTTAAAYADTLLGLWVAADEAGSAVAAKGLFSLVAACGGAPSVVTATRYVRTWHGQRPSQSKALVAMLAHHRDPAAAEALVAIAYRFKAPSIERAAREEVAALADRRGWTTDELADRTVATSGFDEHGVLELDYGPRTFRARLLPDVTVELTDADGTVLKALPTPRQSDDAEAAAAARKTLSAARKQLTQTVQTQTARLHDALYAQRSWSGAAWRQDLAGHPVLARLVAQLVWVGTGPERTTFRLLDDGTLSDADDTAVELPDDAEVRVAHDVTLTDDEVTAWQEHLTDYEVPSLFGQLGRGRGELTEQEAAATRLDGTATLPVGRLRQRVEKLGYRRGAVGDAAAYDWFEKEFASLGLTARVLLADGIEIEDHEAEAEVDGLMVEETATGRPVPLGELPPVLLVELRRDLAVATAA